MATYSTTIMDVFVVGGGGSAGDSPPAGHLWVVRDIVATNFGATSDRGQLYLGVGNLTLWLPTTPGHSSFHDIYRFVINDGDVLYFSNNANDWSCTVSGYVLPVP